MQARASVHLVTPSVPNFVRIEGSIGMLSIGELSEAELNLLAEAWKVELHAHAERKRRKQI